MTAKLMTVKIVRYSAHLGTKPLTFSYHCCHSAQLSARKPVAFVLANVKALVPALKTARDDIKVDDSKDIASVRELSN